MRAHGAYDDRTKAGLDWRGICRGLTTAALHYRQTERNRNSHYALYPPLTPPVPLCSVFAFDIKIGRLLNLKFAYHFKL